jgi:transposase-like protein/IS1 family transposase
MNPQDVFCPNIECPARGQTGKGNISIHSQKEQRYICSVCHQTFTATKGSIFYRLRTSAETVMLVITLLAYGCPLQAIVKAFGFDERTVRDWWQRAGKHCQAVHEHQVEHSPMDLQQVQADEIKVKAQAGHFWMALAMAVPTRLWLGGVVSTRRDLKLIQRLTDKVKGMALCRPLLLAVDGLSSYVTAFRHSFRVPLPRRTGEHGRPRLLAWPNIAIVQVVKQRCGDQMHITRRIVQGGQDMVARLIQATQGHGTINTAFIERLNATFRQRLNSLARRTRTLLRKADTLTAGMYVVGCMYNFCDPHHSLRLKLSVGSHGYRWVPRTPALAAGLTDHIWTHAELLTFKVPLPRWEPPKQRGRPAKETLRLIEQWCQ